MIWSLTRHLWQSKKWSAFHSPQLFRLFQYACDDTKIYPQFQQIESYRKNFLASSNPVTRTDKGAGSKRSNVDLLPLKKIARASLSNSFQCRFMSRLVRYSEACTVVELGTSLGISTAYLGAGISQGNIYSAEGDPILSSLAHQMLQDLNMRHVYLINDSFENFITSLPREISSIDVLFIDGDHRSQNLLKYYEGLSPKLHPKSIVIVDDIHWSKDMESGWQAIINRSEVTQSVDCFYFGLLFFNSDFLNKEHHIVRMPVKAFLH